MTGRSTFRIASAQARPDVVIDNRALHRLASRQHGLVTRDQAAAVGLGRDGWYSALRAGRLLAVAPRVAALPGAPTTPEQRILAAVLSTGGDGIASHRSAAHLWGIPGFEEAPVDLVFADRSRSVALPWVCAHTPTVLTDLRPVRRAGIPATNPLRLLVDLGQVAPAGVAPALRQLLFAGTVSRTAVEHAVRRHSRRGRHGLGALRAALDEWDIESRPPDSVLELRMAELLRSHDLPPATFHAVVLGCEVDFAIVELRIVLECDGWEVHGRDREQFEWDRARDAEMTAAGWSVLRFTWSQITRRPAWVAATVRATVASRLVA